jgi:uncharacterized protein (TIGR02270 family)
MSVPSIPSVLDQHAVDASFLWQLRSMAITAPHYILADLAKLDRRVEAHLDGLRVAGEAGWQICREALTEGEAGEVFAAAVLALENGNSDRAVAILESGTKSPELARGLVSALGWLPSQQAEPHLTQLLTSPSPAFRRVGIAASAIHRKNPGPPIADALASTDAPLSARALRAVGELGLEDYLAEVRTRLADSDDGCRFWAAWTASLLSANSRALAILQAVAESNLPYREKALLLAIRRMDLPAATAWHLKLAQDPKLIRIAIIAAGAFGDPASIPWLMEQLKAPEFARVAGEAFTMITGVDIAFEDLDGEKPEDFEAGPTENAEDVELDPDENLPWPEPELIAKWWSAHQQEFQKGTRYLMGKPITVDWMWQVLRVGRQRQRAAAALELAIRKPGQPLFNVKAPGFRQQEVLGVRQ